MLTESDSGKLNSNPNPNPKPLPYFGSLHGKKVTLLEA